MVLLLPEWISLEYTAIVIFKGVRIHIIWQLQLTNDTTVSFTYINQEGCSRTMGSILQRTLTVRSLIWRYIFLLVNSSGTTYHNLHSMHINGIITRNKECISASSEHNARRKHALNGEQCCLPPSVPSAVGGLKPSASGPSPARSAAPGSSRLCMNTDRKALHLP